ncbi:MAG TPA: type I-C CRISPR-associated protein Cas7/Csd2 [Dongiaceae bacterium]|jgi:CRISPR-associated protein Csd2
MSDVIAHRYDFLLLFDVEDGNPNGDPDAGNLPRIDPETQQGLVTDVAIKRKLRNWVLARFDGAPPNMIYVTEGAVLQNKKREAYAKLDIPLDADEKKRRRGGDEVERARAFMCQNYWDIRSFGAVMGNDVSAGQVRGPVQLTFARSVDPIVSAEHAITRMAVETPEEAQKQQGDARTMGRKFTVPYGLYVARGFVAPHLAEKTGFSVQDLETLKQGLGGMFELDRSAARGFMATRAVYAFRHESALGNAPAGKLFELVRIRRSDAGRPPRSFADYAVTAIQQGLPPGVTLEHWC